MLRTCVRHRSYLRTCVRHRSKEKWGKLGTREQDRNDSPAQLREAAQIEPPENRTVQITK